MTEERVDVIDEEDRVVAVVTRSEMRRGNLLHRATGCFVLRPDARLFVQERTLTKDLYPGYADVCVGGTVVHGEAYDENVVRELEEEMGIAGAPVYPLFTHRFDGGTRVRTAVYACVWDGPVVLQPEEVAGGDWRDEAEVLALIDAGRVCPDTARAFALFRERWGGIAAFLRDALPGLRPL
jgi:isopentenyldiphosphate isomerase